MGIFRKSMIHFILYPLISENLIDLQQILGIKKKNWRKNKI